MDWLDLPQPEADSWEGVLQQKANRGNPQRSQVQGCEGARPDMLPTTRQLLQAFYAPWNAMLAAQLGSGFTWEYADPLR